MVSLRPVEHNDGFPAVGILFTREEFHGYLMKKGETRFSATFVEQLFNITEGHIGAMRAVLRIAKTTTTFRQIDRDSNTDRTLDWDSFTAELSTSALVESLSRNSVFGRCLPSVKALQKPEISSTLSLVAQNGTFYATDDTTEMHLDKCVRSGWLHCDAVTYNNEKSVYYFFPSPLHRWHIQWRLFIPDDSAIIKDANVFEFAVNIVKRFNPRAFTEERLIRRGVTQNVPEAQYQDEFYRCSHAHVNGAVVSYSEFGTSSGPVDFYVKSKQWAIELLRDGDRLATHAERFSQGGKYYDLPFQDYVILDCRTSVPKKQHAHFCKLYHVVFSNNYTQARILKSDLSEHTRFALVNN